MGFHRSKVHILEDQSLRCLGVVVMPSTVIVDSLAVIIHGVVDSHPVIVNMKNSPSFWAFGSYNGVGESSFPAMPLFDFRLTRPFWSRL
jgi:hypothetical protein